MIPEQADKTKILYSSVAIDGSMTAVILFAMKTAVSIPDRVFQSAEKLAARLGVSRSELYARALSALVEQHREDVVTSKLNEIYDQGGEQSSLEQELGALQTKSIPRERW
jgi:hypothetical protein